MAELKKELYDVTIMGSGPAGLTAAIYTARAHLEPVLFEGPQPGGQLTITTDVENYPGFPEGVMGPDFINQTRKQARRFGTEIHQLLITKVDTTQTPFLVELSDETTFHTKSLIVASGASARLLGLESESRLMGHGVSTCATCDGFFFQNEDIVVVGGGDSAIEEAIFLTKFGKSVTVIHRRDELRASKILQKRAMRNHKIKFVWDSEVMEIYGEVDSGVNGVRLLNRKTGQDSILKCQAVFIAIGHIPNTSIFKGILDLDEAGYIKTVPGTSKTNIPGIFAVGDVQDTVYRQAITAAGSGCKGAIDAEHYLESLNED